MTDRISLALVFHNHQPVGNFGWVFEENYERSYEPMIGALERHPRIRVGLHYTGPLLEWMVSERPESIERIRALVARGQVEILGGGLYEPILVSLPQRDRHGQLMRMRSELERVFGAAPVGAWLAERVWEPSVPYDLASAGYEYTIVDDNHLRGAAVHDEDMWGTYTTDDQGRRLTVFTTEKGLRYHIPWKPVDDLIGYLRQNATADGKRLGMMGDDGEKFGGWPGTHDLCWGEEQWVDRCFTALETNSSWVSTVRPSDWMDGQPSIGRIYIPTSSYVEMTEWALPPERALEFHHVVEKAEKAEKAKPWAPFVRGGLWRNFQARYREINDLHKQMLGVSSAVQAMTDGPIKDLATDHLHRAQSNDCYWHGLFGGIYIVHMRMATYHHLIAADDLARLGEASSGIADFDLDGADEVLLGTPGQSVLVDIAEGAGIGSWDLRATRVALAAVLRRRPEAYHEKLRRAEAAGTTKSADPEELSNPHEDMRQKESNLSRFLTYDNYERRSGLVRVLARDGSEVGDFVHGEWTLAEVGADAARLARATDDLIVTKSVRLGGNRLDPRLTLDVEVASRSGSEFHGVLEVEWNINLSGGGRNLSAYYRWADGEMRHDEAGSVEPGTALRFGNEYDGVDIAASAEPAAAASWYPIETVSNSEAGFERMYQGSCLLFRWPLKLEAGGSATFSLTMAVSQSRDRSAEEIAELDAD
ncbi:MAG TPA: alpha-amylase/4-alpha-glucanotransferase domain-containing protein [Candidatus Limnocylindrales bacterium]|nr:alpha-amylase/4-alpha-glucanotransferase domain-containing protein [Candidatus Limnocylindrales bacterium]